MQNIKRQGKELFLHVQENKKKHIKEKSNLSELTKAIHLQVYDFEKRPEKDKNIKELRSEVSDLNATIETLENQLDCQEDYPLKNCLLIRGITESRGKNTDDIYVQTIDKNLGIELIESRLDRTYRIGYPIAANKKG